MRTGRSGRKRCKMGNKKRSLRVPGQQKGYFAVLQMDKSMDDEATEAEITALENECNDVLFSAKSDLIDWSSRAYLETRPAVWAEHNRHVHLRISGCPTIPRQPRRLDITYRGR